MPTRLGRYAVRRRIGSGGFATVWLAYDEQLDSPVAVKVLADNWTEDAHVRQRFLEEGRFLRKVESPHVVSVYDAGELDDGRPYLVMAYADQGTLADRLELGGFSVSQGLEIVRQLATGLEELHDHGVLHRDVKPANVLFRTSDRGGSGQVRAMIGDLGLGKALDMSSRLTMIAGTPSFVAPEQAQGEPLDARADQYSLACLTYLLLTGRPPYSHASLSAAAAPTPPAPMSTPERTFPPEVEAVVLRALSPDRRDRWPSVTAYADALVEACANAEVVREGLPDRWLPVDPELTQPGARPSSLPKRQDPLPDPVPPRRPRRWPVVVGALLLLVAGGLGGYAGWQRLHDSATISDASGTLSVTVPRSWSQHEAVSGWTPPTGGGRLPALSVGDRAAWETSGEGVFIGLLPATKLPRQLPQHSGCSPSGAPVQEQLDGDDSATVYYDGCPGVVVERVVQLTASELLWVQVRSTDRDTADAVLDSVTTRGIF